MLKTPLPEIKKSSPFSAFFIFLYVFSFLISFICVSVTRHYLQCPPPPRTVHLFLDCATGPILLQAVQIIKLPKNEKKLSVGFIFYYTMTLMHKNTT